MTQPSAFQASLPQTFKALLLTKDGDVVQAAVTDVPTEQLPVGDVTVQVEVSSLNYKDGLAVAGRPGVVRNYPMVPGIDFAGKVLESGNPAFKPGDDVVLTGWGVGERHWGGYSELARVKGEWLVGRPERFSAHDTMAIGTAGLTAMLCVLALEDGGLKPGDGEVLVTGAAGGVGSVAVSLLAALGYDVTASTGRVEQEGDYLRGLGARSVIHRDELSALKKPLEKERWAAAVDVVGGDTLAGVLASTRYGGQVAACGLAGGMKMTTSVAPFILRGVTLRGVESVTCPAGRRQQAWERLSRDLPQKLLAEGVSTASLADLPRLAEDILAGKVRGRVVVQVAGE
ncbi:MDR family oxidoreductase [Deinococcus sp.]|uniref:acrylyl-CoA reductase (NADPH) n=1 Tax=Deinococcus sp. TaxID=47478 RepID=UPI0025C6C54E|nr:MDR family oxidoreductase [Deinococcus sp.]